MKLLLLIFMVMTFSINSYASRLIEVEDYYTQKANDFIKSRYPKRAFTVYVKVEAEEDSQRRVAEVNERQVLNLPYLEKVRQGEHDFWSRKDLSLGTMISYLKSVYVKVDLDGSLSGDEAENFKAQLFQHLKLSPIYDKLDVAERVWSQSKENKQRTFLIGGVIALLLAASVMLFITFQSGVRTLVKGIAGPLSDIGKSTENFSRQPALATAGPAQSFDSQAWQKLSIGEDQVQAIKKQIQECSELFSQPDGVLLKTIEDMGNKNPRAMGAIFREMNSETVKFLFQYGTGSWWYTAITQGSSLNQDSAQIMSQVAQVKLRAQLAEQKTEQTAEIKKLGLLLSRLDHKMFGSLLQGKSFEQASPVLCLVPKDLMIRVSKYLYPGQWAELLNESKKVKALTDKEVSELTKKSLELCPLQDSQKVKQYFAEADLAQYLDAATTKDEREVYRVMGNETRIKKERFPFYKIFDMDEASLSTLSLEVPLASWAVVLDHCDNMEKEKFMKQLTQRQAYMLQQTQQLLKTNPPTVDQITMIKKQIVEVAKHYALVDTKDRSKEISIEAAA